MNLSKYKLNKYQISLLSRGPKFCPTTKGNFFQLKTDPKEFTRKLKLIEYFHECDYEDESIVKNKSNFIPNINNDDLTQLISKIENENPTSLIMADNLNTNERKALAEIKSHQDIVIQKADKVNTLVMDKGYYTNKLVLRDHLNTSTYEVVPKDTDKK